MEHRFQAATLARFGVPALAGRTAAWPGGLKVLKFTVFAGVVPPEGGAPYGVRECEAHGCSAA